jgi:hypothetical protein
VSAIPVEAPARILETHVVDRFVDKADRAPRGYRNVTWPVERAYDAGKLSGGKGDPNVRWTAMLEYASIYETALTRSGRDSTDLDIVSGGGGFAITEAMSDAIKKLISIDSHMSTKDRTIIRSLCDGHTLAQAVEKACNDDFVHTVAARVRDALDALDQAITDARNNGFRYVRMVR